MAPNEPIFSPEVVQEIFEYNKRLREIDYTKRFSADDIDTIVYAIFPYVGCCAYDVTPQDVHQFRAGAAQYLQNQQKNKI